MGEGELDLGKLVSLLRRQLRVIVIAVVVGVAATALVVFSLTPIYQATALVVVDPRSGNLLDPNSDLAFGAGDSSRVASELEIMKSDAVLLRLIERESLVGDEEFGARLGLVDRILAFLQFAQTAPPTGENALRQVLRNVRSAIAAEQVGLSSVIRMSAKSESRDRAAELANSWADVYIEEQVSAKIESTLGARNIVEARLADARTTLVAAEGSLDDYLDSNLSRIVGETGRADIANIGSNLRNLVSEQGTLSAQIDQAEAGLSQRNWSLLTESLASDALDELQRQRERYLAAIETAAADEAIDLRSELADVETRLASVGQQEIGRLRQAVAANQTRETDLRERLRSAVLGSSLPNDMLGDIFELQQNAELGRRQYQALLSRARDLDTQSTLQVADSRVVSRALAPEQAAFPRTGLSLAGALLVSLAAGVLLAFLRENLVGGLLTEDQAQDVLGIRVVSAVPRVKGPESGQGTLADLMASSPFSPFPEAIRRIRAAVGQSQRRQVERDGRSEPSRGVVAMITSSTPHEGKSTMALSLARAYAVAGARVCLVDSDLRRPNIHAMLGRPGSNRLTEYLSGPAAIQVSDLAEADVLTSASLILGGDRPELPTDHLIGDRNFQLLVEQLRAEYDVVLLDAPPLGPVADGLYLAAYTDVVLFVILAGRTSQTECRLALASLREAVKTDTTILGVLNAQDRASAHYKGAYGEYYYGTT